jgi:hypothetical protein
MGGRHNKYEKNVVFCRNIQCSPYKLQKGWRGVSYRGWYTFETTCFSCYFVVIHVEVARSNRGSSRLILHASALEKAEKTFYLIITNLLH